MRHRNFLKVQLVSTFALLGAAFIGCATGNVGPVGGNESSSSGGNPGNPEPGNPEPDSGNGGSAGSSGQGAGSPGGTGDTNTQGGGAMSPGNGDQPGGDNQPQGDPQGESQGKGIFEAPNAWTKYIADLPKNAESDSIINWLDQAGGWGGGVMKIDFGIEVLSADASTPMLEFNPTNEFYSPDCDEVPFPVPPGGALEGEEGYQCNNDGDCHLIVVHKTQKKLYEMWRADISGNTFNGGCVAVWDLTKSYPENLRGEGCTSADAGGFPIAAMLFTPEEVANGAIEHAIRFILPNARIRENVYVHPGTHSTNATSGPSNAPPYGVRLRLRKDYPLDSLPPGGAKVIAKALQEYGMFLSDGGTVALTGESDRFSAVKWDDLGINSYALSDIKVTDMEVVDMGEPISWSGDCERN